MRYGLPYMGSKNSIVEWVISKMPKAENFYDLFCGGCAITHGAMLTNKFKNIHANDLNPFSLLFLDAIKGKYHNENRWISREEFEAKKDTDPYIAMVWSFGNNCDSYLYSQEIEPWKKALHYARVFKDYSLFAEMGIKTKGTRTFIVNHKDKFKKAYIKWYLAEFHKKYAGLEEEIENLDKTVKEGAENLRQYLCDALKVSGKSQSDINKLLGNQMSGHYFGKSQWEFPTRENYEKMKTVMPTLLDYDKVYGLQEFYESLQSLESLERLERLESNLTMTTGNYYDVEIKPNSLIYCDIPYKGTAGYTIGSFDHAKFYEWAKSQKELVMISEYSMPEGFTRVASVSKRGLLSSTANNKVIEGLYVPNHQVELYKERMNNGK